MTKAEKYKQAHEQIKAVIEGESDPIANFANATAILKDTFRFWWVGFYLIRPSRDGKTEELVLGPFQGPVACTRIAFGKGVCGTAWKEKKTIVVPDVHEFPGHIACNSQSRSEIVVPIFDREKKVIAVLDVDSEHLNHFDEVDARALEGIIALLGH